MSRASPATSTTPRRSPLTALRSCDSRFEILTGTERGNGRRRHLDLLTRLRVAGGTRRAELRLEVFNVFNHFNWGDPVVNILSSTFGKITTQTGDPRILQFGVKYDF